MATSPIAVSILSYPETTASMLYGYFDVLNSVGVGWPELVEGEPGERLLDVRIVAASAQPFACSSGIMVAPHAALDDVVHADLVCIPELTLDGGASPVGRYPREVDWIRRLHGQGATIAAACSGSMLLADTGLLDGFEATTHWGLQKQFKDCYPDVLVRAERILCVAGEGHRLVTAGGQVAWHDMILYLIARFCGAEQAIRTAKVFLLDQHNSGQSLYASLLHRGQHNDAAIADCQNWIAHNYRENQPVNRMIDRSSLAPRTFARRFRAATGYQPMEYVQALRIEEAKQLLELTTSNVDDIAREVGYEDPASFRRLFKRNTGLTPAQYRRKMGSAAYFKGMSD